MSRRALRLLPLLLAAAPASAPAQTEPWRGRPVHTYSIVARDPETGQFGVAVQSHYFSVGPIVPWAEPGVGAVATQSLVEVSYGPLGLELMRAGKSAPEALAALLAADAAPAGRQVAMIDAEGRVAAHTGPLCIPEAGHRTGAGYSVQANLMLKDTVWDAMARAYEAAEGDLAERLLAALDAAEAEGGDIRGRQSAALLVVAAKPSGKPWADRLFDLRVEDHPDPLGELRRLVRLRRAYTHVDRGDEHSARGDLAAAGREYALAQQLAPDNIEIVFWHAVGLANTGRLDEALPLFRRTFEADRAWATLVPRLVTAKLLPDDPQLVQKILAAGS